MKLPHDAGKFSEWQRCVATYDYVLYHLSAAHYNIASDKIRFAGMIHLTIEHICTNIIYIHFYNPDYTKLTIKKNNF